MEVAACHYSHLSAAVTATGKVCIIRLLILQHVMYNFLLFHLKGIASLSETVTESNYYKDQKLYSSINCVVDLVVQLYSTVIMSRGTLFIAL